MPKNVQPYKDGKNSSNNTLVLTDELMHSHISKMSLKIHWQKGPLSTFNNVVMHNTLLCVDLLVNAANLCEKAEPNAKSVPTLREIFDHADSCLNDWISQNFLEQWLMWVLIITGL